MKALAVAAFLLATLTSLGAHAETFSFALIGDTPYSDAEHALVPELLEEIGRSGARFVIHVGDFKNGRSLCSDEVFADRHRLFDAAPLPFVYVPGDNEWIDCRRATNGSYDPAERLAALRRLFFAGTHSLGPRPLTLERQSAAWPEHQRWRAGPLLFITLNLPGSDNNIGRKAEPSSEFRQRMPQVLAWLREAFALARRDGISAVVIAMQADPYFELLAKGMPHSGFREFFDLLRTETETFAGEVVLVHGDTHRVRVDQPLTRRGSRTVQKNFTRVETQGSPFMGWISVAVDTRQPPLLRLEIKNFPGRTARP